MHYLLIFLLLVILKFLSKIISKSSIFTFFYCENIKFIGKTCIIIEIICISSMFLLIFATNINQAYMIYTITISIALLVGLNFLLLKFSCNKTNTIKPVGKKPIILSTKVTKLSVPERLAPTGS